MSAPKFTDFKALSFDVYGTLIDWESGIYTAFSPLLARLDSAPSRKNLLELYNDLEHEQQKRTPDLKYSELLSTVYPQVAEKLGVDPKDIPEEESKKFGQSVPDWPAFADTLDALRRLSKRYKLIILSNVDETSIRGTIRNQLNDEQQLFANIFTAEAIGSYKPDLNNFEYLLKNAPIEKKDDLLHVAQSKQHDHGPAEKIGLTSCWINRPGAFMGLIGGDGYKWEFKTLGEFADAVEKE